MKVDLLQRIYDLRLTLPSDTTPERIQSNRDKLFPLMCEVQLLVDKGDKDEAFELFLEEYHYFDLGHKSKYHIDSLPENVKRKLAKSIAKEKDAKESA